MNLPRRTLAVALLGLTALAGAAGAADGLLKPRAGAPEFLPVDEAFEIQPLVWQDGALEVSWRIAKDYYLYRDKLQFAAVAPAGPALGAPALPPSLPHEDEHFGTVQIYRDRLVVRLPLAGAAPGKVAVKVAYQGCADAGLCYPPQTRTLEAAR
jgi:thiol:disulfide interchange protein